MILCNIVLYIMGLCDRPSDERDIVRTGFMKLLNISGRKGYIVVREGHAPMEKVFIEDGEYRWCIYKMQDIGVESIFKMTKQFKQAIAVNLSSLKEVKYNNFPFLSMTNPSIV